jgi:hypothetical protein
MGRLQQLTYVLLVGLAHLCILPFAFALDGRDGVDDVRWHFWDQYPGGSR